MNYIDSKEQDIKKLKIIYKKPTCYNDNETSSTNSSDNSNLNNLDESVSSDDSTNFNNNLKQDYEINQNDFLRNSILREINDNNLNDKKNNEILSEPINNNQNKSDTNSTYLLKKFVKYLKNNNINFEELNDNIFFNNIIKKYIVENNIEPENVISFLEELKLKINLPKNNLLKNIIPDTPDTNEIDNSNKILNKEYMIENFQDYPTNIENENKIKEKSIMNLLINNDINTWLFIGVILISLVLIIMVTIYKK